MAYDEALAARIRAALPADVAVDERAMFGGLGFFVGGHMAVCASGQGGLLVRADPAEAERLVAAGRAVPMEMRSRPMRGWLRVDAARVRTARQLGPWVQRGLSFAGSLPPK